MGIKSKGKKLCIAFISVIVLLTSVQSVQAVTSTTYLENSDYRVTINDMVNTAWNFGKTFTTFDIVGIDNGNEVLTTYANEGYISFIRYTPDDTNTSCKDATAYDFTEDFCFDDSVTMDIEFALVRNDAYIEITYILENVSDEAKTVDFGFGADVKIGSDDNATINTTSTGISMASSDYQFSLAFKNIGETNATDYWFGYYGSVSSNFFNQIEAESLSDTDSGLAVTWQNQTILAGETKEYSILVGVGEIAASPVILGNGFSLEVDEETNDIKVSVSVSDEPDYVDTLYCTIEGQEMSVASDIAVDGQADLEGIIDGDNFEEPGLYTISLWVQNDKAAFTETGYFTLYKDSNGNLSIFDYGDFVSITIARAQDAIDPDSFDYEELTKEAQEILDETLELLESATTQEEADKILEQALEKIEIVQNKNDAKEDLNESYSSGDDTTVLSDDSQSVMDKANEDILNATTQEEIEEILTKAKEEIEYYEQLMIETVEEKQSELDELLSTYNENDYRDSQWQELLAIFDQARNEVNSYTSISDVLAYVVDNVKDMADSIYTNEQLLTELSFVDPKDSFEYGETIEFTVLCVQEREYIIYYVDSEGNIFSDAPITPGTYEVVAQVVATNSYDGAIASHSFVIEKNTAVDTADNQGVEFLYYSLCMSVMVLIGDYYFKKQKYLKRQ